jgi:hypothetical protein
MSQLAGMNPWLTMWSQPRTTVRALVHSKPSYGVFYLAAIYMLQSFFFYFNWWSLGLNSEYYTLFLTGVILSPLVGFVWLYYIGWIFRLTGRMLSGDAPASHLRAAIAWAKIPYSINALMWFILILMNPDQVFIQDGGGPSSVFVNFISLILAVWSLVLLIQSVSEVQQFTVGRSILNVLFAWIFSSIILFLLFMSLRYIYIMF